MKKLLTLLVFGLLSFGCSDSRTKSISTPTKRHWYQGGTLHKAKICEWKNAAEENKLATCGDFMAAVDNSVSMDVLLERATELVACINEATRGIDNVDNDNVTDLASICALTLGYK